MMSVVEEVDSTLALSVAVYQDQHVFSTARPTMTIAVGYVIVSSPGRPSDSLMTNQLPYIERRVASVRLREPI